MERPTLEEIFSGKKTPVKPQPTKTLERPSLDSIFNRSNIQTEQIPLKTQQRPTLQSIFSGIKKEPIIEKEKKGLISPETKEEFKRVFKEAGSELSFKQAGQTGIELAGRGVMAVWEAGFNLFGKGIKKITPDVIEDKVSEIMSKAGSAVAESKPEDQIGVKESLKLMFGLFSKVNEEWQEAEKHYPDLIHTLEGAGGIASVLPVEKATMIGAKGAIKAGKVGKEIAGEVIEKGVKTGIDITKKGVSTGITGAKEITEFGVSQATGLNRSALKQIIESPEAFTKEAIKNVDTARETLAKNIKTKIDNRLKALSETGEGYQVLRESNQFVNIPEDAGKKVLEKYKLNLDEKGKILQTVESIPLSPTDKKALQDFINVYNKNELSANAFLNARQSLSSMAKYETGKTSASITMSRELRKFYDELGKKQIKGLKELDAEFSKEIKILNQIKKDYINPKTGDFKDNAISKIANLTGKGKEQVLERLKGIDPNIEKKVNILKALENIKDASGIQVGTYVKSGLAGFGFATANIPLVIGSIISNPTIAVPLIRKYASFMKKKADFINKIIDKLNKGKNVVGEEKIFLEKMLNDKTIKETDILKK